MSHHQLIFAKGSVGGVRWDRHSALKRVSGWSTTLTLASVLGVGEVGWEDREKVKSVKEAKEVPLDFIGNQKNCSQI